MNSKEKGDIAVGQAIAYYSKKQEEVSLPLGDKKHYDLIIDREGKLLKVQIKYTSFKSKYGIFMSQLRVKGGNQSYHTSYSYQEGDFDLYVVYTAAGNLYEIPYNVIKDFKNSICLGKKYEQYKIN